MQSVWLVRYGVIPEVARFRADIPESLQRGASVVIQSPRGLEMGELLQSIPYRPVGEDEVELKIERLATAEDLAQKQKLTDDCQIAFAEWWSRIQDWQVEVELLDLEWTLDRSKLILYVLSGRGPESTKLALYAATTGIPVEVQPVGKEGLVPMPAASHGCGCSDGGCSTKEH